MTNRTKWTEYTGSDEQIAEMRKSGFIVRDINSIESQYVRHSNDFVSDEAHKNYLKYQKITHYWPVSDDPLREMKIRWAQTGQPVWTRRKIENEYFYWLPTTTPDWNIPNAEYSFTEFKEEA